MNRAHSAEARLRAPQTGQGSLEGHRTCWGPCHHLPLAPVAWAEPEPSPSSGVPGPRGLPPSSLLASRPHPAVVLWLPTPPRARPGASCPPRCAKANTGCTIGSSPKERERERERENRQRERERERERDRERERRQRERERERERERDKERQRRKEEWERERAKRDEKDRQHRDRDRDKDRDKEKEKPKARSPQPPR